MTQIVTVNVSQSAAPTPSNLQQKGAIISQGATTLTTGTSSLITQVSDLTAILQPGLALTSLAWASGTVTATTTAALPANFPVGAVFPVTIAGVTPAGYNGQYQATVTGASTFTYSLATDPGTETAVGTYTITDELSSQVSTFFAQGSQLSVYVLELGPSSASAGITALKTYIDANPNQFYSYLVPRAWDSESTFYTFIANYSALTAKTYFFVTTTNATYTNYTAKETVTLIEAPAIPLTEFSIASLFWVSLNTKPSSTNRSTPFAYSFVYGVTAWPQHGNNATLATYAAAHVNYIASAAEGGLTNTMVYPGQTSDGRDFSYWYSADWIQINLDLNISNAIINGSNNPLNPLYYSQDGINRLQDVATGTFATAISYGLATGTVASTSLDQTVFQNEVDAGNFAGKDVVNAIPFTTYTAANPNDYAIGKYNGLSGYYIPARGFGPIVFNLNITDFLSQ